MQLKSKNINSGAYIHTTPQRLATSTGIDADKIIQLLKESEKGKIQLGWYNVECLHEQQVRLEDRSWFCHDCNRNIGR